MPLVNASKWVMKLKFERRSTSQTGKIEPSTSEKTLHPKKRRPRQATTLMTKLMTWFFVSADVSEQTPR